MPSNRTPTRFHGPDYLVGASATLYTVPANKIAVVRQITARFAEVATGTFCIGSNAAADQIFDITGAGEGNSKSEWFYIPLTEGEVLVGMTDGTDTGVVVTVDGDLYDE